jgi:hypothetical protein
MRALRAAGKTGGYLLCSLRHGRGRGPLGAPCPAAARRAAASAGGSRVPRREACLAAGGVCGAGGFPGLRGSGRGRGAAPPESCARVDWRICPCSCGNGSGSVANNGRVFLRNANVHGSGSSHVHASPAVHGHIHPALHGDTGASNGNTSVDANPARIHGHLAASDSFSDCCATHRRPAYRCATHCHVRSGAEFHTHANRATGSNRADRLHRI